MLATRYTTSADAILTNRIDHFDTHASTFLLVFHGTVRRIRATIDFAELLTRTVPEGDAN